MAIFREALFVGALVALVALARADTYKQKINCFAGFDDCNKDYGEYDPPSSDYIQKRLGPGVGIGVICIVLCCLVYWTWCCCRCWASCCPCCRAALCRCCCGAGVDDKDMRYSKCDRCTLVLFLLLSCILIGLGGGLGYMGGHKTFDGSVDLMDQALTAVTQMETLNTKVAKVAFTALGNFYAGAGSPVNYNDAEVTKAITDVKKIINDAKDSLTGIKSGFNYGIPAFFGFCFAITLFGWYAWLRGSGCCSKTMGLIGAVLLFLSWLLFVIFYAVGVFLDDTCVNLSDHYHLDCMKEPGKTCQRAKLTDFFQCPKITTVSTYYKDAWNMLDTSPQNGAGANSIGSNVLLLNMWYGNTKKDLVDGTIWTTAPAALDRDTAKCGKGRTGTGFSGGNNEQCSTVTTNSVAQSGNVLGMEPYTTCKSGYSFNSADSTLDAYLTTPIHGNRNALCTGAGAGAGNSGTAAPQNNKLAATAGSTNPAWADSSANGGEQIGTCERACLNASATSSQILDSLSNFGGNCMFRKFVYESFTTAYDASASPNGQGYATCGNGANSKIAWTTNTAITSPQIYQNYSSWMGSYSAGSTTDPCIPATHCPLTNGKISFTAGSASNYAACFQAAAMAVTDIMWALSYIASCEYIKTFARLTAVESTGACFDLGDGLVYLTAAQGLIGAGFFIVTVVGIKGARCFDPENDETKKNKKDFAEEDLYINAGVDRDSDAPLDLPYQPAGTSTELGSNVGINPNEDAPLSTGHPKVVTSSV